MTYYKKCHTVTMASWMENSEAYSTINTGKKTKKKQALVSLLFLQVKLQLKKK